MARDKIYSFIPVFNWMITRLKLSGNELLVFAVIYSFCRDKSSEFRGSKSYLAETIGCSRQSVINALKSLTDVKGFLVKTTRCENGMELHSYKVREDILDKYDGSVRVDNQEETPPESLHPVKKLDTPCQKSLHPVKKFDTPCQKTLHNNKDYNIKNINNINNINNNINNYSSSSASAVDGDCFQATHLESDDKPQSPVFANAEVFEGNDVAPKKKKKTKKPTLELTEEEKNKFQTMVSFYPNQTHDLYKISNRQRKAILDTISVDEMKRAIQRYVDSKEDWKYYKNISTWFLGAYKGYTDAEWNKSHPQDTLEKTSPDSDYDENGVRIRSR